MLLISIIRGSHWSFGQETDDFKLSVTETFQLNLTQVIMTTVFEDWDLLHYGFFGPKRWQEDNIAKNIICNIAWIKPFIY
jgi:hypothetical protein